MNEDLTGQTFNRLRVTGPALKTKRGWVWPCVCTVRRHGHECGNRRQVLVNQLRRGSVKMCQSCGQAELKQHRKRYARHVYAGS